MYQVINSMPFEMYIFVLGVGLFCFIYGMYDMRKKQSKNPMMWMIPFGILTCVFLLFYRFSIEFAMSMTLQKIANIGIIISGVLFIISLIITFIIAKKTKLY
ncbi:MAG: hypothetical protein IJZ35_02780 [Clostridia bacterium]|nr:hypothetical protein [Clostridia bacterium]